MNLLASLALSAAALLPPSSSAPATPPRVATGAGATATLEFDQSHQALTDVLSGVVHGDKVDYATLKRESAGLRTYLDQLENLKAASLASWSRPQRYAFWINVYNAYTLDIVTRNYPLASIKDIGSATQNVWKTPFIPLGHLVGEPGKKITLDRVEHEILRPTFQDARVHAAVNCASEGCPPLRAEAFQAEKLERQLDEQTRAWLADSKRNRLKAKAKTLQVSRLFDWFKSDFEGDSGSVLVWMSRYTDGELSKWLRSKPKVKLEYLDYGWELNDTKKKR